MVLSTPESLLEQGRIAKRERRLQEATDLFRKALTESHSSEDESLRAVLYEELAYVERSLRDLELAERHYRQASELYRGLGNLLKTAIRFATRRIFCVSKTSEMSLRFCMPRRWKSIAIIRKHRLLILLMQFADLRC